MSDCSESGFCEIPDTWSDVTSYGESFPCPDCGRLWYATYYEELPIFKKYPHFAREQRRGQLVLHSINPKEPND